MNFWYQRYPTLLALLLTPLSVITFIVSTLKRLRRNKTPYTKPVVVVGNLTVGGTGKTPTIIWLVNWLKAQGYRPAVVSRGYGATVTEAYPILVQESHSAHSVGDEPKLIFNKTQVPVVIDPKRHRAVSFLCEHHAQEVDVIISDDGMQHYQMFRDIELLMVDGERAFGNGLLLPAGPLRESKARQYSVDFTLTKQFSSAIPASCEVAEIKVQPPINCLGAELEPCQVVISSGIGNFTAFKNTVIQLGFSAQQCIEFKDHQPISDDVLKHSSVPIVVTEKDYVKIKEPAEHIFQLPYALEYRHEFQRQFKNKLETVIDEKSHHNSGTV